MSNYTDDLTYTLAKRIPNMERGFKICTDYGDFFIHPDQSELIIKAAREAIERDLRFAREAEQK